MKKTIGILGGMGPLATADFYRKIVEHTAADNDNGHIRVYIDSNSAIPDRTAAILSGGADPVPEMLSALRNLEKCGADCIVMPCNTAHYFLPRLQEQTSLPILNMPELAAKRCGELFPGGKACILATNGTLDSGVYCRALEKSSVPYLLPDTEERTALMHLIYDVVKGGLPLKPEESLWQTMLDSLRDKGADYFVLACTELPILADAYADPGPYVDSTLELAAAAIRFCGFEVRP